MHIAKGDGYGKERLGHSHEGLLSAAMATVGTGTKKEALEGGLKSLVRERNREALRKGLGTFEIDLTLEELDTLRHAD